MGHATRSLAKTGKRTLAANPQSRPQAQRQDIPPKRTHLKPDCTFTSLLSLPLLKYPARSSTFHKISRNPHTNMRALRVFSVRNKVGEKAENTLTDLYVEHTWRCMGGGTRSFYRVWKYIANIIYKIQFSISSALLYRAIFLYSTIIEHYFVFTSTNCLTHPR